MKNLGPEIYLWPDVSWLVFAMIFWSDVSSKFLSKTKFFSQIQYNVKCNINYLRFFEKKSVFFSYFIIQFFRDVKINQWE